MNAIISWKLLVRNTIKVLNRNYPKNVFSVSDLRKFCSTSKLADFDKIPAYLSCDYCDPEVVKIAVKDMVVYDDFISKDEEEKLMHEVEPYIKRLRYESSHWDDAIHGYRETEKANWNNENKIIIDRVRNLAFQSQDAQLRHVHVLDITAEGYIKPHVDSIKFCGDTITGLSLLSTSVMRLVNDKNKSQFFDILLKQRSLYIMKGQARYDYTHEILPDKFSYFKSVHIPRNRRISIICRNAPPDTDINS